MLNLRVINYYRGEFQQVQIVPEMLHDNEYFIGSDESCDLILNELSEKRVYARIRAEQSWYSFKYFGSSNDDVFINNDRLSSKNHALLGGDIIRMGRYVLMVEAWESPPELVKTSTQSQFSTVTPLGSKGAETLLLRCVRINQETPTVKTISFVAGASNPFNYQPGQQIVLEIDLDGSVVPYPVYIASSPTRPATLDLPVQATSEPDQAGRISQWLYNQVQVGSQIAACSLPKGLFPALPSLPKQVMLISNGMGIVPFISMIRWVYDTCADLDIVLIHSAPTVNQLLFRHELMDLSCRMPNVRLAVAIAEPPITQAWMGYHGSITAALLQSAANDWLTREAYICGTKPFLAAIEQILQSQQFPPDQYHAIPI